MDSKRAIKHAIKRKFPVIDSNDSLDRAIQLMAQANVSVLAVKVGEELVGLMTVRDVMQGLVQGVDIRAVSAGSLMTKCEFTTERSTKNSCFQLDEEEDILSAMKVMYEAGVNHLLVTGEKNKPLGIVSSLELVKFFASPGLSA
jgi:predicted transcriptional regulator